ncbi:hypothetical protein BBC27_09310 [Acidithiobacillus ferrivorans]|uniref:Uncharacterized protein n=1 Tax=Acidithiobacillus ferrivorans TaxID=160808 RepID=A0A1B9BZJ8_9PROT|nr:hypothetical protein BBC27_09310 [Acidithiobacillus ferrivorans]
MDRIRGQFVACVDNHAIKINGYYDLITEQPGMSGLSCVWTGKRRPWERRGAGMWQRADMTSWRVLVALVWLFRCHSSGAPVSKLWIIEQRPKVTQTKKGA